jgi:hypothetical protein
MFRFRVVAAVIGVLGSLCGCGTKGNAGEPRQVEQRQLEARGLAGLSQVQARARTSFHAFDGDYLTFGTGFSGRFAAGAFTLAPTATEAAGAELSFERARWARGGEPRAIDAHSELLESGALSLGSAGVREVWQNIGSALEQRWEFDERPLGSGDLVLRLKVTGEKYVDSDSSGLHFVDPASGRGTRYGVARWIDGEGHESSVQTRFVDGELTLRVADSVVSSSHYPAVLDPVVSPEFVISPVSWQLSSSTSTVEKCTLNNCMYAWLLGSHPAFSRFNGSIALDPQPVAIAPATGNFALTGKSDEYLFYWRLADGLTTRGVRINPLTGAFIDDPAAPLTLPNNARIVGLDSRYLVLWPGSGNVNLAELDATGSIIHQQAVATTVTTFYGAEGNGMVALTWLGHIQRFSGADLTPIDAAAVNYPQIDVGETAAVAYDGANFVMVWGGGDKYLRAGRMRASDGQLLEPDDTFNQLPGSVAVDNLIYATYYAQIIGAYATPSGILAIYGNARLGMYDLQINTTGATISASADSLVANYDETPAYRNADFFHTHGLLAVATGTPRQVQGLTIDATRATSAEFPLSVTPNSVQPCAVTSNGNDFLVAWRDSTSGALYASRLRGDGLIRDPAGLLVAASADDAGCDAAAAVDDYQVVYRSSQAVYHRAVSSAGLVGAASYLAVSATSSGRIASDGVRYMVVYSTQASGSGAITTYGQRFDISGNALTPLATLPSGAAVIAANRTPDPDQRTFMVAGVSYSQQYNFESARVRAKLGGVLSNASIPLGNTGIEAIDIASSGEDFASVWSTAPNVGSGVTIDDVNGTLGSVVPVNLGASSSLRDLRLSFDGTSFVAVWADETIFPPMTIEGRYLTPALASSGAPISIETNSLTLLRVAAGSDNKGRTLIAYTRPYDASQNLGVRVNARFMDSDTGLGGHGGYANEGGAGQGGQPSGGTGGASGGGALSGGSGGSAAGGASGSGAIAGQGGTAGQAGIAVGGASGVSGQLAGGAAGEPTAGANDGGGEIGAVGGGGFSGSAAGVAGVSGKANVAGDSGVTAGAAAQTTSPSGDSGGCGCSVPRHGRNAQLAAVLTLLCAIGIRRRWTGAWRR